MEFEESSISKSMPFEAADPENQSGKNAICEGDSTIMEDIVKALTVGSHSLSELVPVQIDEKLLKTSELEISSILQEDLKHPETENNINLEPTVLSKGSIKKPAKNKDLTSTEVTNALFAEFEEKLTQTLSQFNVDDVSEMQKQRAILRKENAKLEESISNLERQLASATLAKYLIQSSLGQFDDDITDSETIEEIRSVYAEEKYMNDAARNLNSEHAAPQRSDASFELQDTPKKVVAKTLKRLLESSIIGVPSDNGDKKIKITEEIFDRKEEYHEKVAENGDSFTISDDQLMHLMKQILEIADEALQASDQNTIQDKHPIIQMSSKRNKTSAPKRCMPAFTTQPGKKLATRSTRRSSPGELVNPLKYHNCQLCKAGYYSAKDLHSHYVKKHPSTNEENGTFGVDAVEDQISTKCHLCGHIANSADDLHVHKSHHVKPEFCAHKCNKCDLKFCLKTELDIHKEICDVE